MIIKMAEQKSFIVVLLFSGWFISSLDRMFINIAIQPISKELQLDPASMGLILSVFYLSYTIMQIPGGVLADKFGSKIAIIVAVLSFSIFAGLSAVAWSVTALLLIRFMFGIGEGAFPGAATKLMSEHFTADVRSRVQSILLVAIGLGSFLASIGGAYFITQIGWRNVYVLLGLVGILLALVYYVFLQSDKNKAVNQPEAGRISLKVLLRSPSMWQVMIALFGLYTAMWGLLSWVPSYFVEVRKINLVDAGIYASLPAISTMIGYLAGGWLVDKVFVNKENYLIIIGNALAAISIYAMFTAETLTLAVTYQVFAGFFFQIAYMGILSVPLKRLPSSIMGSAFGVINTGANLGAFITPAVMGLLIKVFDGSYEVAFYYLICGNILSLIMGLLLKHKNSNFTFTTNEENRIV